MLLNMKTTAAAVFLLAMATVPAFAQEQGQGKAAAANVDPPPRWPDGTIGLGSTPGAEGYWQSRPGAGGGTGGFVRTKGPGAGRKMDFDVFR